MDRVNRLLIVLALVLSFLMVMALRQPLPLGISSALNNISSPLGLGSPSNTRGPVAIASPGTNTATPSSSHSNGNPNSNAKKGGPTPAPAPSYPVFPTLPPIFWPTPTPAPRPTPAAGPLASFSYAPSSPQTGQRVSFDGTASGCGAGPCTYNWTDDACASPCGDLGTGPTLGFTFLSVGTKSVRLTIIDALGRRATVEHNVAVAAPGVVPTPTPGPTPTPTPPIPTLTGLAWRPPTLVNPITVTLCNCNISGGNIMVNLNVGQDYILKDPVVLNYPVVIAGGHNIVWIGGEIRPTSGPNFGIQLIRNVGAGAGTVHLEGIYLDGVLTDGIVGGEWATLSKPGGTLADATLQLENIRIESLSGDSSVNHQDCIQQYGGWRDLRVDHFTCNTLYQGFNLPWEDTASNNRGVLSHWDLRNANLHDAPNSTGPGMQTLMHFGDLGSGAFSAVSHQQGGNLSNVYLHATQNSLDQETYPNSGSRSQDGTTVHSTINLNGAITWANSWAIPGFITPGDPPGGDYVPRGAAGLNYVSPGYQ